MGSLTDCLSAASPFAVNEHNTCNEKEEGLHPLAFIPANVRLSVSLDIGSEAEM